MPGHYEAATITRAHYRQNVSFWYERFALSRGDQRIYAELRGYDAADNCCMRWGISSSVSITLLAEFWSPPPHYPHAAMMPDALARWIRLAVRIIAHKKSIRVRGALLRRWWFHDLATRYHQRAKLTRQFRAVNECTATHTLIFPLFYFHMRGKQISSWSGDEPIIAGPEKLI